MPEATAQHHFIKSVKQADEWVAMVADAKVLDESNLSIEALRSASRMTTFNTTRLRAGVHFMNADQLAERIGVFIGHGLDKSAENMQRALDVINEKNGKTARAPALHAPAMA